jgi:RNA polymerase sigma-70 factor (ECF subfamily)
LDDLDSLRGLLRRGDTDAWRRLVRALAAPLFRYVRPAALDDSSAEDVVQQTFIRMLRAKLRDEGSLRTFAFRIATNLLRDEHRNRATRRRHEQGAAMGEVVHDDPTNRAAAAEAWQAALLLPAELREVVLLRYGQGFTAAEAAAVLGLPEGTVKTRQRRALETLRNALASAPALPVLEGDLAAAAMGADVSSAMLSRVEAIVMASIGTKTGVNI